jgi:malate dehydrogenase (oxaloacetate-decarboxylating)(NADP+)
VDYVIPTPFDPRLLKRVSVEVARAAAETGAARKPITDLE